MIFNFDIGVYFKSIKTEDMNSHVVVTVVDRHVTRLRAHSSRVRKSGGLSQDLASSFVKRAGKVYSPCKGGVAIHVVRSRRHYFYKLQNEKL